MLDLLFEMNFAVVIVILNYAMHAAAFAQVFHGVRLGDFPPPNFKRTIKGFQTQNKKKSFKRLSFPSSFQSIPDLVRVYASTQDGDSAGFRFEGSGACQNPGSTGNYGGLIFAYNAKQVYLWAPTKYSGNTNGKLIYVEDGWGGEKYTQSSRIADVTIEAWWDLPTPNFQTEIQVDNSQRFYEIPHKLKQIPDFMSIRVYTRNRNTFKKDFLFHFHAVGASQTPPGSVEYGGVIYSYNETFVRLWLPNTGSGLKTGCIVITKGWGNGRYANEMNADICQVEIRAWINAFPLPAFQTEWKAIRANAHQKSFREIHHNLGVDTLLVQVHVKQDNIKSEGFIHDALGSIQSTQSDGQNYGGVLFAYDKSRIRVWVASSDTDENGRAIFVSNSWGNRTHVESHDRAIFRIRIYAHMCKSKTQILDGQGVCRAAEYVGLSWQVSPWGNCSSTCTKGIQQKKLTGCFAAARKTVISCGFERGVCGFTGTHRWERSRGSLEQKGSIAASAQPPYGYKKGSFFIYSAIRGLPGGSYVQLRSPRIVKAKNCNLKFHWNTGVYYHYYEVHVLSNGKWRTMWKMSDKQPGNPYIWRMGFLNLEHIEVEQFRFALRLKQNCRMHCGYVAFDNIELTCESEKREAVSLHTCDKRAHSLPGCAINVSKPLHKGPAFSIVKIKHDYFTSYYVMANGTFHQTIGEYPFRVGKDGLYTIWIEFLGAERNNSVSYIVDYGRLVTVFLFYAEDMPGWSCLSPKGVFLRSGIHTITLLQYGYSFKFRGLRVSPKHLNSWASLGMQNLHINDNELSGSLTVGEHFKKPSLIRLNGQGAWDINDHNFGWVHWQIRFPDVALVNRIAVQGGCNPKLPVCCACQSVQLKFTIDGVSFSFYRNSSGDVHNFKGAYEDAPHFAVESELEMAVPARGIRFYPFSEASLTCLRVEVYGSYLTKEMCAHSESRPSLVRECTGDRRCGKNAECFLDPAMKGDARESCHCSPGFHGPNCENVNCDPNPCQNDGICKIQKGMFSCLCKPGYIGKFCQTPCPSDKYGPDCSKACFCTGKSRCHPITGACVCAPGYMGKQCDQRCPKGKFGANCVNTCKCSSITICDPATGSCYCPLGTYGRLCENPCLSGFHGRNCSESCQCGRRAKCLVENGTCLCVPGWTGKQCEKTCDDGWYGVGCMRRCNCSGNALCTKDDGSCFCKNGWIGKGCNIACPEGFYGVDCRYKCNCSRDKTKYCDHVSGKCVCKVGFSGIRCQDKCGYNTYGPGCKLQCRCRNDASCDPLSGKCQCLDGYTGKFCESPCPRYRYGRNCIGVCTCIRNQTDVCDSVDGICECNPGYKGRRCQQTCRPGRWGKNCDFRCNCNHGAYCDPIDGICSCTPGWEGEYCNSPCSNMFYGKGCKQRCQCKNGAMCNRFNGSCTCAPGFAGKLCDDKCPRWKYGKDCDNFCSCNRYFSTGCSNTNGTCHCRDGYQGKNCDKVCDNGTYGPGCKLSCPSCLYHVTGPCDKVTGKCRCMQGYHGIDCKDYCPFDRYGQFCSQFCNCTEQEICSNIDGRCIDRKEFEFYEKIRLGDSILMSPHVRRMLTLNIEKFMAKYYISIMQPVSVKRRDIDEKNAFDVTKLTTSRVAKLVSASEDVRLDTENVFSVSGLPMDSNNHTINPRGYSSNVDNDKAANPFASISNLLGLSSSSNKDADKQLYRISKEIDDRTSEIHHDLPLHRVVRRDVTNKSGRFDCDYIKPLLNMNSFSVRVTSVTKKFGDNGEILLMIGMVALFQAQPQGKSTMEKFLELMPKGCLLAGVNCDLCAVYTGKVYDKEPGPSSLNLWIIIGATLGGLILCATLAIYLVVRRRRQNAVPTIYKVKKNSRDIELRPCLANGDGSHVLAFENPYYDVIAAMGLDDDIEEDYYNPLYTYDDVSLYCDDQGSDSETETNHDDGYQYPYDRDSGISSGTIHQ